MLAILALIQAAASLLPELKTVVPTVEALINGKTITPEEEAALTDAINALNAQAIAAVKAVDEA